MILETPRRQGVIELGNLRIDLDAFRVRVAGRAVTLGLQEFDLLSELARQPDRILSAEALTQRLWGDSGVRYAGRLSVLVYRLRHKLADSQPYRIRSVRGRGYGLLADGFEDDVDAAWQNDHDHGA